MATTTGLLCEQIERLIYAGDPSTAARIHRNDIKKLVEQQLIAGLKARRFNENLPEGDHYPSGTMIAEYSDIPVESYKNVARAKLPATPVSMPLNMGIWHVGPNDNINEQYIPLQSGQFAMAKDVKLLGEMVKGYQPMNGYIVFSEDIRAAGVDEVYMQLLVTDIMSLSDWDILPVPQDMEAEIVTNVYNMLVQRPPADRIVDQNDSVNAVQQSR
jgi:hypothetical protein